MKKIQHCFILGTRPEVIKFASLYNNLKIKPYIINTGQQNELFESSRKILKIKTDVNLNLMKKNQPVSIFISRAIKKLSRILKTLNVKYIWVEGDTSTALAGALTAYNLKIPIIHLEAGLRTHDLLEPFPEEGNRILIDHLSYILFAPTKGNKLNLNNEGITKNVFVVGNTVVDTLEMLKPKLSNVRPIKKDYVIVTMHRREAFGKNMEMVFLALKKLTKYIDIIFPAHLNPVVRYSLNKIGLKYCQPFDYKKFLLYLKFSKFVLSDSGGVQEEVPSFKKQILILRNKTERPELLSNSFGKLVGWNYNDILASSLEILNNTHFQCSSSNPFGDGNSFNKIINVLRKLDIL